MAHSRELLVQTIMLTRKVDSLNVFSPNDVNNYDVKLNLDTLYADDRCNFIVVHLAAIFHEQVTLHVLKVIQHP